MKKKYDFSTYTDYELNGLRKLVYNGAIGMRGDPNRRKGLLKLIYILNAIDKEVENRKVIRTVFISRFRFDNAIKSTTKSYAK